ncbi:unnamed protein product [Urochloa decumbens]|uniref:Uncharacterized protein n=1 Tax=Urochloa decumbens TaxID=240449 RepID=A0ABC8YB87_9POAL
MGSITRDPLQNHWVQEVEEEEVEEEIESSAAMDALFRASEAKRRKNAREWMEVWAKRGEVAKEHGYSPTPPPIQILDHPDLFERAWGWDTILPYSMVHPLSKYKKYLQDYYNHNEKETNAGGFGLNGDDHVNGLAALAHSCTKMEDHLMFLWDRCARDLTTDEMEIKLTSERITKRAREMINALESDFPAAAISFKCITKEAELMYQWLISGNATDTSSIAISNEIRQCALSFMTYRKHEYIPAAAAMMGIMKEAKLMCELMRKEYNEDTNEKMLNSFCVRNCTLSLMLDICDECSAVGVPTRGIIPANLNFSESDGMGFQENVDKVEGKEINKHKDESNGKNSKKQLARNNLEERDRINENKPMTKKTKEDLARNNLEKRNKDGTERVKDKTTVMEGMVWIMGPMENWKHSKEDMLITRQSPLGEKADEMEDLENKNGRQDAFSWPKPGGRVNGAAGSNGL